MSREYDEERRTRFAWNAAVLIYAQIPLTLWEWQESLWQFSRLLFNTAVTKAAGQHLLK